MSRMGVFKVVCNVFPDKVIFLLGRCKKNNNCVVCPSGRMTMQSWRCPSSWPVSMLLRNSKFPAFAFILASQWQQWQSRGSLRTECLKDL